MTETAEHQGVTGPSGRMKRWMVVVAGLLVVLMLVLGLGGLWVARRINPPGGAGGEVALEIPLGSSTIAIANLLEDEGVITDATIFRAYLRWKGEGSFLAGRYTLAENMAMGDVVAVLSRGPEVAFDRVTIPEGYTVAQIAERLGELPRFDQARIDALLTGGEIRSSVQPEGVSTLEGLLLPETYFVDENEDEEELVRRMVGAMEATLDELDYHQSEQKVGLTPYETVIVASLIEREARVAEDRAKISRVIHNRLAQGMRLQIDATVLYALGEHKTRVLFRDLEVDSPYNTYKVTGLPPTPIAAPGPEALEAAMNPADGDWLYYVVVDEDGRHAFATDGAGHQRNIREAERRGVR